ncbi:hypothetical protein CfE428DRAFT_2649 [Chthoniobacter flavus Ellin428]|uniref:Uncharacterized protein n=1 Tax=Chthoniobacter flavus Ellin428 TaxID=497964 RepID=B4D148_9BACT|nr:hypothetical protein CfE428DRAFT_2649 [Chthoniobacter flavus Ellin428]TCO93957.1 hypothetical protein EV701_10343 [Chthoniobacter flavus]
MPAYTANHFGFGISTVGKTSIPLHSKRGVANDGFAVETIGHGDFIGTRMDFV